MADSILFTSRCLRAGLAAGLISLVTGCGNDGLQSATSLEPPDTDGYDPSVGHGEGGGYYSTGGAEGDDDPGPVDCPDDNKRCAHTFELADDGYASVSVFGSFASDGWENGVPMLREDGTWSATLPLRWDTQVEYKFLVDGDTWVVDPNNPDTAPDGQGGTNSVLPPTTCEAYTCEPDVVGTFDWRDAIIYFTFVDRFYNGDPSNDDPIGVPFLTEWQGGDWAGVKQKIEEGFFEDLGINTLWLSVPMDNSDAMGLGFDGREYSAYHGYWPSDLNKTESRFGTLDELQDLVDVAHERGLKVLFDYAMNHVHIDSPVYAANPGWFWPNDNGSGGDCLCGAGCSWDGAQGRRCWFIDYLPSFNFTSQAALDFSVSNAIEWIHMTGVDGYRLDAVKHIEDEWILELRARVTEEVQSQTGEYFYMVGETFTGDQGLIAYYVNSEMLDGQFDFPLRMEMARTLLMRQGSMNDLVSFMDANDGVYGAGIMSTFIGNHDIPRPIHLAQDTPLWNDQWADGKDRAWNNQPGLPSGLSAFERLANAFTILMTTKGAPLVYYGDEYGMPGAGDPDNRRFMQWTGYSAGQQFLFDHIKRLIEIRKAHPATRRGSRTTLSVGSDTVAYTMTFGGDVVHVALNRSDGVRTVGGLPAAQLRDELTGQMVTGPEIEVPARSARVLVSP